MPLRLVYENANRLAAYVFCPTRAQLQSKAVSCVDHCVRLGPHMQFGKAIACVGCVSSAAIKPP